MPTPQARIRNIALRQGAQVIKRHDGEPKPETPRDPNLKSWSVHLIGGKKMQSLGYVEAADEPAAIEQAVFLFSIDSERRKVYRSRRSMITFFQPPSFTDAFFDGQIKLVDIELAKLKDLLEKAC
jgi:hypothetical protein